MHDTVAAVLPALRELPEALDILRELVRIDKAGGSAAGMDSWKQQHDLAKQAKTLLIRISPLRVDRVRFVAPPPRED